MTGSRWTRSRIRTLTPAPPCIRAVRPRHRRSFHRVTRPVGQSLPRPWHLRSLSPIPPSKPRQVDCPLTTGPRKRGTCISRNAGPGRHGSWSRPSSWRSSLAWPSTAVLARLRGPLGRAPAEGTSSHPLRDRPPRPRPVRGQAPQPRWPARLSLLRPPPPQDRPLRVPRRRPPPLPEEPPRLRRRPWPSDRPRCSFRRRSRRGTGRALRSRSRAERGTSDGHSSARRHQPVRRHSRYSSWRRVLAPDPPLP
jgi:hypothetical protein